MLRRRLGVFLPALILFLGATTPAAGQDRLKEGMWTGTVIAPDGQVIDLEYEVSYVDDALGIELFPPPDLGQGSIVADNPTHEAEMIVFTMNVGESVSCSLARQEDGSYEGECVDSSGEAGLMIMIPPDGD